MRLSSRSLRQARLAPSRMRAWHHAACASCATQRVGRVTSHRAPIANAVAFAEDVVAERVEALGAPQAPCVQFVQPRTSAIVRLRGQRWCPCPLVPPPPAKLRWHGCRVHSRWGSRRSRSRYVVVATWRTAPEPGARTTPRTPNVRQIRRIPRWSRARARR